ncbi:probable transcription factor [Tanacetum coccineum]
MASDNDNGDQFLNDEEDEDIDLINDDDSTSVTVAVAGTPTVTTTTTAVTPSTIDSRRLFQKLWTDEDEIELLQGYYDHITTRGMMTSSSHHHHDTTAFYDEIKRKLQLEFNKNQLVEKLRRLKKKYRNVVGKIASGKELVFKSPHDQATFDISSKIWNNDDEVQNHNLNGNGNGNGNEIGDMEKKVRSRKRARPGGVKIEEGYVQPLQQFGHGLGVGTGVGNQGGVSRNVNANVVEETVKSCLLPLFKELANNSSNGGSRGLGLGLGGMNLDSFGIGDMSDDKWRKQHILELEVYLKRLELMQDQVKSRLDELRYAFASELLFCFIEVKTNTCNSHCRNVQQQSSEMQAVEHISSRSWVLLIHASEGSNICE